MQQSDFTVRTEQLSRGLEDPLNDTQQLSWLHTLLSPQATFNYK